MIMNHNMQAVVAPTMNHLLVNVLYPDQRDNTVSDSSLGLVLPGYCDGPRL